MDLLHACVCGHDGDVEVFKYFGDGVCMYFASNYSNKNSEGDVSFVHLPFSSRMSLSN